MLIIKKRIFIAVNLTEQAREELLSEQKDFANEMPVKLTRSDNLHITLCFLGSMEETRISKICEILREIVAKHSALELKLLGKKNHREFLPHITLGRIREWQWRQIDVEERPLIEKDISINFKVISIDVMESQLKRTGAEYSILKSFSLK
jgi:2'-5' RNA ligase